MDKCDEDGGDEECWKGKLVIIIIIAVLTYYYDKY